MLIWEDVSCLLRNAELFRIVILSCKFRFILIVAVVIGLTFISFKQLWHFLLVCLYIFCYPVAKLPQVQHCALLTDEGVELFLQQSHLLRHYGEIATATLPGYSEKLFLGNLEKKMLIKHIRSCYSEEYFLHWCRDNVLWQKKQLYETLSIFSA